MNTLRLNLLRAYGLKVSTTPTSAEIATMGISTATILHNFRLPNMGGKSFNDTVVSRSVVDIAIIIPSIGDNVRSEFRERSECSAIGVVIDANGTPDFSRICGKHGRVDNWAENLGFNLYGVGYRRLTGRRGSNGTGKVVVDSDGSKNNIPYLDVEYSLSPVFSATIDNTLSPIAASFRIGTTGTWTPVAAASMLAISPAQGDTVYVSYATVDALPSHFQHWTDGTIKYSSKDSNFAVLRDNTTILAQWAPIENLIIVAPSATDIQYKLGVDSTAVEQGTVLRGGSKTISFWRASNNNMTLVLTASDWNIDTFGGWTRDGTVIDRWSNPATIIANTSATYSCIISSTPRPPSNNELLCDRYGALLFAGISSSARHTIAVTATYDDGGTVHIISSEVGLLGHEVKTEENISSSWTKSVSFDIGMFPTDATTAGRLLYADKPIALHPPLARVFFHCQVDTHKYSVEVTLDGVTVYHEYNLSGTFSKSFLIS
ncbi:MAG: hypothetical protein RR996_01800 [Alistipes sp.]